MTDWKAKLKEAKELLDLGLIDEEKYQSIQAKALQGMGLEGEGTTSRPRRRKRLNDSRASLF